MNYSILFLFSLLLSFLQYFFHRQFKRIGTKNKLQVMNLILATHAKPVLAHKAPTICPSFLYQSIHPALCPNHIPSHMWMLYKVNLDWKKEDNAKKKKKKKNVDRQLRITLCQPLFYPWCYLHVRKKVDSCRDYL